MAQDRPIGYWRSHLPYNTALGVATDGITLYTACTEAFFTYDNDNGNIATYSKVEGMSDIGMACVAYDHATKTTVLAYQNGNIDLFKDNTFYNIPDLKIKQISGTKSIHHIYIEAGNAYLSTDIGVLVIDLANSVIQETYVFTINSQTIPILDYTADDTCFYAATPSGLFKAQKKYADQLQNFSIWTSLDNSRNYRSLAEVNGRVYVADTNTVFHVKQNTLSPLYVSPYYIDHIDPSLSGVMVSEYHASTFKGAVKILDSTDHISDSFSVSGKPVQGIQLLNGKYWIADAFGGLFKRTDTNELGAYRPEGPADHNSFDIYANNKTLWIAHGGYNDLLVDNNSGAGISTFTNDHWRSYSDFTYAPFSDSIRDLVAITKDVDGTVYAGSFRDGLFSLKPDGSFQIFKQNSILDHSFENPGLYQVFGLGFDHEDNLWMTMFGSPHELVVKTAAGAWYKYAVPVPQSGYQNDAGALIVDQNDQIWYTRPAGGGGGVVAYNPNGTPADGTDDAARVLQQGVGYGNLPSNVVYSLAQDNNGDIWIGTNNGIGIMSCANSFVNQACDATIPIVQYDKFANYLFVGENVRSIAVDGGNEKWVGTDNGVWLLSPDASKILYHFTIDNSPLPSNHTQKITIDPVTGDVYIGTDFGLVSYRGAAVAGGTTNSNVVTYPDPIKSGYTGTIAIKGLVTNADVRITDITGQLVYRTTALGGQAIWNGMDYKGHRPQSGVYLIFVTNTDGSQTYAGKMVFMQ